MFALVNAILLRPLPFADPDRLVTFTIVRPGNDRQPLSLLDVNDFNESSRTLDGVASVFGWSANLTGRGDAERLTGMRVSGNYFELTGAQVELGRPLQRTRRAASVGAHQPWHVAAAVRRGGRCSRPADRPERRSLHDRRRAAAGLRIARPRRRNRGAVSLPATDARRGNRAQGFLRVIARTETRRHGGTGRRRSHGHLAGGCATPIPTRTVRTRRSGSPRCTRRSRGQSGADAADAARGRRARAPRGLCEPRQPLPRSRHGPTGRSSRSARRSARPEAG